MLTLALQSGAYVLPNSLSTFRARNCERKLCMAPPVGVIWAWYASSSLRFVSQHGNLCSRWLSWTYPDWTQIMQERTMS